MNKNFIKRPFSFLKKEGFYIILFICLCVAATAAYLAAKNTRNQAEQKNRAAISQSQNKHKDTAKVEDKYDNALQVKKSSKAESRTNANSQKQEPSKGVSNSVNTTFQKPVEGNIARGFSTDPVYWDSTGTYRPNLGYDIQVPIGKPVFASMTGKVEEVNTTTQDGVQVIINHQNGLKTVYSNLDPNLKVSKGQNISKGQVIGVVGNTSLRSGYEKYGDHLHFGVLKGNSFVDPGKYIKY